MNDIQLDQATAMKQGTEKTIDRSGWGLFLIWIGVAFMFDIGWGVGLLGVGCIFVGAQAMRRHFGLDIEKFGLVIGVCFGLAGLSRLLDLQLDKTPIPGLLVPTLLIIAGIAALVSAWRHRPGA